MRRETFVLLFLLGILYANGSAAQKRPNILFLIADDWSFPHAGVYGDPVVRTPIFARLAKEGALFTHAFTAAPSCSPSRAAILTGRYPHQLESGGNLWPVWPAQYPTYVSLLEKAGYFTGSTRKGWGPGDFQASGLSHNPAGKSYADFESFLKQKPKDQPFTFWFGSYDPHREYQSSAGIQTGMKLNDVIVPKFLPDNDCIRNDILDYYFEIERFDRECGQLIRQLEEIGELENTIIVMTSDNGMPFPRAKANIYDHGTRMPLVIRWPHKIPAGTVLKDFVNFVDFAPSFLEAAGLKPEKMSGQSLWPLFAKQKQDRAQVFLEKERHANVRKGNQSYPMRGVRNHRFLYIWNPMPERDPAGNPTVHQSTGQYGDVDNSITKFLVMNLEGKAAPGKPDHFALAFGPRSEEELYDVVKDPYQLQNLAADSAFGEIKKQMRGQLLAWMEKTGDPRSKNPRSTYWDELRFTPNYQMRDFDVQKKIGEYRISGPDVKNGIPCISE